MWLLLSDVFVMNVRVMETGSSYFVLCIYWYHSVTYLILGIDGGNKNVNHFR